MTAAAVRMPGVRPLVAPDQVAARWTLPAILVLALVARIAFARTASIHHPDEVFQYLEPAHRMVFGYGVVPWEYEHGIRSHLFPLILSAPMRVSAWWQPGGTLYLMLCRALMVALSLAVPWSGWMLGRTTSRAHAIAGALVGALWAEFLLFAPHTLSENLAVAALLPAAALLGARESLSPARLIASGALLAFGCVARFQLAPAALVLAAFACRSDWRKWRDLAIGGSAVAIASAAVDIVFAQAPFAWLLRNVGENLLADRAAQYGTMGPLGYVSWLEHVWGWWLLALVPLIRLGMRRQPALFWAAIGNLALHSLIAHKEYRFVLFSSAALILLAAIGTVDAIAWLRVRWPAVDRRALEVVAVLGWLTASTSVAAGEDLRRNEAPSSAALAATDALRQDAAICGVGLLIDFSSWGGATYLHRPVPVSLFDRADPLLAGTARAPAVRRFARTFNRVLADREQHFLVPEGYKRTNCYGSGDAVCVYARPGGCAVVPRSPFLLQTVIRRGDEQMRAAAGRSSTAS